MGVKLDHGLSNMNTGNYTFRIQGSTYHLIGSAMPDQGDQPKFAQIYFYNVEHELDNRARIFPDMNRATLAELQSMMHTINPFVARFKTMKEVAQSIRRERGISNDDGNNGDSIDGLYGVTLVFKTECAPDRRRYNAPTTSTDVGAEGDSDNGIAKQRDIVVHMKDSDNNNRLTHISDALHMNDLMNQSRENENENSTGNYMTKAGLKVVLASSFIGGPRHMAQNYYDAMSIVRRYGKPDLFVTFTCNPFWPEIQRELLQNQTASERLI
jgi:hypothetical protein